MFHEKYRPPPADLHDTNPNLIYCGDETILRVPEGVLEGELLSTLVDMDSSVTRGDHFAVLKRLRLAEKWQATASLRMSAMQEDLHQLIKLQGGEVKERTFDKFEKAASLAEATLQT